MTSKQRLLAALRRRPVDTVPCWPNLSFLVPARKSGRPFWEISLEGTVSLDDLKRRLAGEFGYDLLSATQHKRMPHDRREWSHRVLKRDAEGVTVENTCRSPHGVSTEIVYHPANSAASIVKRHITDLPAQIDHLLEWFPDPAGADYSHFAEFQRLNDPYGASGLSIHVPGFQNWIYFIEGGLEALTNLWLDRPELLERLRAAQHEHYVALCRAALTHKPDYIYSSNSGLLTLQSPALVEQYSLPTLAAVTRLAKAAGVPTHLHACGRLRWLVETLAAKTDLSSLEPLEAPHLGDVDLAEVARRFGNRLTLSGNVHTLDVMMRGTPAQVRAAVRACLAAAAPARGFILGTGDQCPPETPDENIHAFVQAARAFGRR